ncbi:MAG TPA: phosphate acyltransferase [Planctomycetota bacterium]|nr:phosphate acyltransferase [Planctomycetota bacterium]
MSLEYLSRILSMAKQAGRVRRLAVAAAGERVCLESVVVARQEGLIEPILYGEAPVIGKLLGELGQSPADYRIVNEPDPMASARLAAESLASGESQIIMKGLMQTSDLLRVYFDKHFGLRLDRPLSHVGLFEVPGFGRVFAMTDAAINVAPDDDRMTAITANVVGFMHRLGWKCPKVAFVAASNRVQENQPATVRAAKVAERCAREVPGAVYAGPLALDESMSAEAAGTKRVDGAIQGDADVLVVPTLETGNTIYKTLTMFAHAKVLGVCIGGKAPIVMTSRSDTEETKLLSMALCCLLADERKPGQ